MENLSPGIKQSTSNIVWLGGYGIEDHYRPDLQRFYFKLRIRCFHTTLPALGDATAKLADPCRNPSGLCGLSHLRRGEGAPPALHTQGWQLRLPALLHTTRPVGHRLCHSRGWDPADYPTKQIAMPSPTRWSSVSEYFYELRFHGMFIFIINILDLITIKQMFIYLNISKKEYDSIRLGVKICIKILLKL